jgi:outer membrane protein assembly factor BamB
MSQGQPHLYEYGGLGAEMFFGPSELNGEEFDQVVVTFDHNVQRYIHAFDLDSGSQRFAEPVFGLQDAGLQTQVHVGHDGKLIMPEFVAAGLGWGLQTFDPDDCSRIWRFDPGIASGMSNPKVGIDGMIYVNWDLSRTSKVDPDGSEVWRHKPAEGGIHSRAVPSPSNDLLIVPGLPTFGVSGWIKALDIDTGEEIFREVLEDENGGRKTPEGDAIFSHDGATAYVYVDILGDPPGAQYCYLYAIATGESGCAADVNGDGALNILDFVAFQSLFTSGDPLADCNADAVLNILDFVCFQGLFVAGCP